MARITFTAVETKELYNRLDKIEKALKNDKITIADPILTTEQVLTYLNVSRRCLQNWRDNGILEYSAVNGKFYYRLSAIEKMLKFHLKVGGDI